MSDDSRKITSKQVDFINRLVSSSKEADARLKKLLSEKYRTELQDLPRREASDLIDELKRVSSSDPSHSEGNLTKKQQSFIQRLQDMEERVEATKSFLRECGKGGIDELSIKEASSLIDRLLSIRVGKRLSDVPATDKQIGFIEKLTKSDKGNHLEAFLKEFGKKSISDLTREEASKIINSLRNGHS